jgi:hypothetical protein
MSGKRSAVSVNHFDIASMTLEISNTSVGHYMSDTCLYYHCWVIDAIRSTLSSQIALLVWCGHPYQHWLFSSSVGSGDVLITDTNSFCSFVGQVTLSSPTPDSFFNFLWCHHFDRQWFQIWTEKIDLKSCDFKFKSNNSNIIINRFDSFSSIQIKQFKYYYQ